MVIIIMKAGMTIPIMLLKHNLRAKLKNNNPAQIVIKLLMTSMYGKTIIKPVETDTIVKDNK